MERKHQQLTRTLQEARANLLRLEAGEHNQVLSDDARQSLIKDYKGLIEVIKKNMEMN